jgi:hypothetical protein
LPSKKQEDEEEEGLSSVFTLLEVISLDCNHETKATLLSYLRAIKHTPKNASILFLSSTIIKSKHRRTCLSCPSIHHCFPSHRHQQSATTQIFMHMHLWRHPTRVRLLGGPTPTNHISRSYACEFKVDETAAVERLKSNHNIRWVIVFLSSYTHNKNWLTNLLQTGVRSQANTKF